MISASPVTADSGTPPAMLLAIVMISGTTPACSIANIFPVRPKPDWISSAMSTIPCRSAMRRSSFRKSLGAGTKPPSPNTGSMIMADQVLSAISDFKNFIERRERALRRPTVVFVGIGRVIYLAAIWSEALFVWLVLSGHGKRQQRASVKPVVKRQYGRAVCVRARNFYRILRSLSAAREQDGLLLSPAGRKGIEPLRELDVRFIHRNLEARMGEAFELLADRRAYFWMRMAEVLHADAGDEVDVLLALDIPTFYTLRALDKNRMGIADAAGDFGCTLL